MATLKLEDFRCVVDTDEIGSESPYFVTWVGNLHTGESIVKYSRKAYWENKVDPGPWWPVGDVVTSAFERDPTRTLALAVMIEEDEGEDLTKQEVDGKLNRRMQEVLDTWRRNGTTADDRLFISTMRNTLVAEVKKFMEPAVGAADDLMDQGHAARVIEFAHHQSPVTVTFRGGNGRYEARYRTA